MFQSKYQCPDCGGSDTFLEKYVLPFFLLKPVRCARCFLRINASALITVREREHRPVHPQAAA